MRKSKLEKLWGGIQPLPNLKSIDLGRCRCLKEIPNLLNATNLETLTLEGCSSLVELPSSIKNLHKLKKLKMEGCRELRVIPTNINLASLEEVEMSGCSQLASFPDFSMNIRELRLYGTKIEEVPSSIRNLHKLKKLDMRFCKKLRVIPTNINLASLEEVDMNYCSQLASFPDISSNIEKLSVIDTKIEDVPPSVARCWSRLECLKMGSRWLQRLTNVPLSVRKLDLSNSDIERIPDCFIDLPHLVDLIVENCPYLVSIPALSPSLEVLNANECVSLERVRCSFYNQIKILSFYHCVELDGESRRGIIQQSIQQSIPSGYICVPYNKIPAEFTHKATRPLSWSITIPLAPFASSRFKACILVSPIKVDRYQSYPLSSERDLPYWSEHLPYWSEHLFIFSGDLVPQRNRCHEVDVTMREIIFEFSFWNNIDKIIECGVQIMTEEAEGSSSSQVDNFETASSSSEVNNFETASSGREWTITTATAALILREKGSRRSRIRRFLWYLMRPKLF